MFFFSICFRITSGWFCIFHFVAMLGIGIPSIHLGMQIKKRLPVLPTAGVSTDSVLLLEWNNREGEHWFPKKCKIQHLWTLTCQNPVCTKDGMKNFTNKIPILLMEYERLWKDTNKDQQNTVLFLAWIRWFRKNFIFHPPPPSF